MAMEIKERDDGKALFLNVTGKLEKEDYNRLAPKVEAAVQKHGKINILVETFDFEGWSASALWEDLKFSFKHFNDVERLAIVGEKKWEKGMTKFSKPFSKAEVRYFDKNDSSGAKEWISPGVTSESGRY